MIQKFLAKYFFEVIPSIVATVVGAYIVTHYINSKSDAEKPQAAVSAPAKPASIPEPGKTTDVKAMAGKADAKKADAAKDTAKAEPKSEPAKPSEPTKPAVKAASRSPDKAEERAAVRASAEAREAEGRDANDLARDALARLRGSTEQTKADQVKTEQAKTEQTKTDEARHDAVRTPEAPRVQEAERPQRERPAVRVVYSPANNPAPAHLQAPAQPPQLPVARQEAAVPPMSPPVTITPSPQLPSSAGDQEMRFDDPSRPTPPADIPLGARGRNHTSVAEDVVSAAKSVFEAVVPR